ncbi:hypothetical protein ACLOJK_009284 [Asimina triloba]
MAHITGLDPIFDHHSSDLKHFLPRPIRSSILVEVICFVNSDSGLPPAPICSVHQLADVDPNLLLSISTSFACYLADEFVAHTSFASHDAATARCRLLPWHRRHFQHVGKVGVNMARSHSATPTTDVCIDDAIFVTVTRGQSYNATTLL